MTFAPGRAAPARRSGRRGIVGAALTATASPSASESDGLTTSRSRGPMPSTISIASPRLRPRVTARSCTLLAASTTATRVPSLRNSSTLVGTTRPAAADERQRHLHVGAGHERAVAVWRA
jgi:hypothetical protein